MARSPEDTKIVKAESMRKLRAERKRIGLVQFKKDVTTEHKQELESFYKKILKRDK
jgi:hypothetical protein